jgi:hypothetical protein
VTSFVANIADPLLKKDAKSSVETSLSSIPVGNLSDSRTLEVHQTFNRTESKTKNNLTIPSKPAESVTASLSALSTFVSEIEKEPKWAILPPEIISGLEGFTSVGQTRP